MKEPDEQELLELESSESEVWIVYYRPDLKNPTDEEAVEVPEEAASESPVKKRPKCSGFFKKWWFFGGIILGIFFAYMFPRVGQKGGYIRFYLG